MRLLFNMQQEAARVVQEIRFEASLDELRRPDVGTTGIEDSLAELSQFKSITHHQAHTVLRLAASNLSTWTEAVEAEGVLAAVSPSIDALRTYTKNADDPTVAREFHEFTAKIATGLILAEPTVYRHRLASMLREGFFDQATGRVLSNIVEGVLNLRDQRQEYGDENTQTVGRMLDDLIEMDDPGLLEPLSPILPFEWLDGDFGEQDFRDHFPRVHQLIEQALLHPENKHKALAQMFTAFDEKKRTRLKDEVKKGKYGDVFDTLGKVVAVLTSDEDPQLSPAVRATITEDLWIELLEINRIDPRLRPLRERLVNEEWYWDTENIMYTLIETLDGMAIPAGEEGAFIARHEEAIVRELQQAAQESMGLNPDIPQAYLDGLNLTYQRGELTDRLAAILGEVRQMPRLHTTEGLENFMQHFPNSLLFASLYTPSKSNTPKE